MLICIVYCMTMWHPTGPPTLIMPDIGIICGIYCGTRIPIIGYFTVFTGVVMIASGFLLKKGRNIWGIRLAIFTGIITIPVGVFPLIAAHLTRKQLIKGE